MVSVESLPTQHRYSRPMEVNSSVTDSHRISRNVPFILGSLVMVLVVGFVGFSESMMGKAAGDTTNDGLSYRLAASSKEMTDRPNIYQFDVVSTVSGGGGSSNTRKIPYIWNQVWESAGWKPQKLMVGKESGKKEYQDIVELISTKLTEMQQRHVLKYLAMHAMGGGWVAHSDTFPLHDFRIPNNNNNNDAFLPFEGKLTSYDARYPCLMSGSAEEWLRMGKRMAEHAAVYTPKEAWSEAVALHQMQGEINIEADIFQVPNAAVEDNNKNGIVEWVWNSRDCQSTHDKRAVHFRLDSNEDFEQVNDPGDMVVKWLSMWLQACERSDYFLQQAAAAVAQHSPNKNKHFLSFGSFHVTTGPNDDDQIGNIMSKMHSQSNQQILKTLPSSLLVSEEPVVSAGASQVPGAQNNQQEQDGIGTNKTTRLKGWAYSGDGTV